MFKYMSIEINDYERFKGELDRALSSTADNMVRIGYLLMQARDTDILKGSGYSGMGEFARSEYNLSPDQTSRFMKMAEKYGDGEGRLKDQWQKYGHTKLSEMLTLPDAVVEAIPAEITREEIRELKDEIKAEQEITPIEAAIEEAEAKETDQGAEDMPVIERFFLEYFRPAEHAEEFVKAITTDWQLMWGNKENNRKAVMDALAPSGIGILMARIPGKGRYILSFKGEDTDPELISTRDNTGESLDWTDVRHGFSDLIEDAPGEWEHDEMAEEENAKSLWSVLYGEDFPKRETPEKEEKKPEKKVKIAPAQNSKTRKTASKDKDAKIEKAMNPPVAEEKTEETRISERQDEDEKKQEAEKTGDPEAENTGSGIFEGEDEDLDNRPKEEIEKELRESLKNIERASIDLANYAKAIGQISKNHTWLYIEERTFNMDELWKKVKAELQIATYLKKSIEMRFTEEQEDEE